MIRRIVVGLDGSDYAASATRVACHVARRFGSTLVGVAAVDLPSIESSSRGAAIGAYEYARRAREERIKDATEKTHAFLREFEESCAAFDVSCETVCGQAAPYQAIVDEARYADGIMVGLRTFFHFETQETAGDTLLHLMKACVSPVVAVPRDTPLPTHAVVACDGSFQSARAMRAFVHFAADDAAKRSITLLHVGEGTEHDKHVHIESAQRYVESFGFDVEVIHRKGQPGAVIEEVADEKSPSMIVMGSYGRGAMLRHFLFGSTAARIIHNERFPVFLYH